MNKSTEYRTGRTVVFKLTIHLVFVTKYRKCFFSKKMINSLRHIFTGVCKKLDCNLIACDGEKDHVHLIIDYLPKLAISKIVNSLKGVSSRMFRKEFEKEMSRIYYKDVLWSPSYFVSTTGGATLEKVKQYVQQQNTPK
jgi:putative transposase